MNLQRFKSVFAIFWLFLFFKFDQTTSTTPSIMMDDEGYCGFSDLEEDICSSYCYNSVKPPLTYIMELKEQMKAKAEEHLERGNELRELRQRFLDLSDYRDHFRALNQQIEELRKTNEILREFNQDRNNIEKTEENIKLKENDLNECIANRDTLKKGIELERNNRIKMEESYKLDLENLEKEKTKIKNKLESKSREESSYYNTNEEILNKQIKDINSQVSYYRKQLEETQNQLTDKNRLLERSSLKIKAMEKDLDECHNKTGCKGLPSGIQAIELPGLAPISALCNGDIDGGGWIVFQKRFDGSEKFYRNWTEYGNGFGKLEGEFFIGLEKLHRITNSHHYELYIQIEYFDGRLEYARHDNFRIGNETEKYKLQSLGEYSGTAENLLKFSLGKKFSTYDQDNDVKKGFSIAKSFHSCWWHNLQFRPHLTGRYYNSSVHRVDSMHWDAFESLKSVQMLIRSKFN